MSMLEVNIVDKKAGTVVKTMLFLKPFRNVVERCPTILRTANQSNTKITQETVVRCPDGWNTCLNVGIKCSCWKYSMDWDISHAWVRDDTTSFAVSTPSSERENDSCKGYRQYLRYYDDDTDVNLGTILYSPFRSGLVCGYMYKMGRSFRSSPRQGKPVTWRREAVRFQCNVNRELSQRKDV